MSMSNSSLESIDKEYAFNPKLVQPPEITDDFCEPFIEKLIKQQEMLNRFRGTYNPGVSLGLYHFW